MISLFTPALSKAPSESISIDDFLTHIRLGKWKSEITAVRNEPDKDLRAELKKSLPGVTISGTFTTRSESNIIQHSNFICIDIDNYSNREVFLSDPYTYGLFSSASGGGLAVIVKIEPTKHKQSFRWIQEHYFRSYGIPVDPAPSSVASLRFVSYDPLCFTNLKAKKSPFSTPKQKPINAIPCIFPQDKVGTMVAECVSLGKNIAESYLEYTTLAFSIASGFGESGRAYFHAIAGISTKYNSEHADKQYSLSLKNPSGGITVGSFYYMLKQAGVSFPENSQYENAIRTAAIGKKSKLSKEAIETALTETLPVEDAKRIAHEVFIRPDITLSAIAADPEKLIESLVAWLNANHPIKKNIITGKLEDNGIELSKDRMNTIYLRARSQFNTPNVTFELIDRTLNSEFTQTYNPLKKYIEDNRHRNTTGNIDRIITSIASDSEGSYTMIRKWLLAIPAAIEGNPIRIVLALTGGQLTGKTEWFRRLLPASLKNYYGESKMEAGKDDELLMCQKLIIMDDELGGKTKQDEKRFKDLTSKNYFSLRAPYDNCNRDYKRLALLCGTSNEKDIVNDPTGNTRILPINVASINHEQYNSVNKDELFMEIIRCYESGENWNFTKDEVDHLFSISEEFKSFQFEKELIEKFFVRPKDDYILIPPEVESLTATEIKMHIETSCNQKIVNMKRFGMELRKFFGDSKSEKIAKKPQRIYKVIRIDNPYYNPSSTTDDL